MRAHGDGRPLAIAAQDRDHDPVMLHMRIGEAAERAKLRPAERLHPHPGRQRDFRQIGVVGAGIDRAVEAFVDLVEALRIADVDECAHFLVHGFQRAPLRAGHALGGKAGAQRLKLGHGFEHAGELFLARPRHHRATVGADLDQAAGGELADRLAHRRARDAVSLRQIHLVEGGAGGEHAAHDLVGELQTQFLGEGAAARRDRDPRPRGSRRCRASDDIGHQDLPILWDAVRPRLQLVPSEWATRNARSSRQGAAMTCTAIGIGSSGTGTAITGSPMNEIGWV